MPNKRTCLVIGLSTLLPLLAAGQDPLTSDAVPQTEATAKLPPTAAELAIDGAIAKLRDRATLAADITMSVDMLNQRFQVVGQLLKHTGNRALLRLSIEGLGDSTGTMQQVCDGTTLWDYRRILDQQSLRTIKVEPVLQALENPDADDTFREQVRAQLGFAGPDALLAGLRKVARFDQQEESTLNDREVWIIRGLWNDRESLALPPGQAAMLQAGFLPSYVPSHITVWLDKETGWPWRVQLEGRVPSVLREVRLLGPDGRPIGRKSAQPKEKPSRIVLEYALADRTVDPSEFLFEAPPNVSAIDETETVTAGLEAAIAELAQRKRSEASKAGDVLDQALPAPRPAGAPTDQPPAPNPAPPPEQFRSSLPDR